MTGRTVIHDTDMIESGRLEPRGLVTVDTISAGRHMEIAFAGRGIAVMTGHTVIGDALVIERGIGKGCWRMAHRAILGNRDVGRVDLCIRAGCIDAIVAGGAVAHDSPMIEHRWRKGPAGHVADTAILGCRDVIGLVDFTSSIDTVMAGIAAHGENGGVAVIDKRVGKIDRVVTQGTIGGSDRVRWRRGFLPGAKRNKIAIVTGDTIAGDTRVGQHCGWRESGNRMTDVTILDSWHMARGLDQKWVGREELCGMTTFAAIDDVDMLRGEKDRIGKSARIGVGVT